MATPAVVLLPPTPGHYKHSSSSAATSLTRTDSLDSSVQDRTSSDTTIATIYSMYQDHRESYSPNADDSNNISNGSACCSAYDTAPQSLRYSISPLTIPRTSRTSEADSPDPSSSRVQTLSSTFSTPKSQILSRQSRQSSVSVDIQSNSPTPQPYHLIPLPASRTPSPSPPPTASPTPPPQRHSAAVQSIHRLTITSTSPAPADGEDPESFHVRSTYAQLDMLGVKGDGFEEGVERTRARPSGIRSSQIVPVGTDEDGRERARDMTPQETKLLSSLDRYGFYVVPSHDRLVLLPSSTFSKQLSPSVKGSTSGPPSPPLLKSIPQPRRARNETSRIDKWGRMLEPRSRDPGGNIGAWDVKVSKERKLRERVYKGIPDRWRSAAWELLVNRYRLEGYKHPTPPQDYHEHLEQPSSFDVQIDLDVPRTINGHVLFRTRYGQGQRALFRTLHCFSRHCTECGYVQGMGPLAATFLCYFDAEKVYTLLTKLHDVYSMHTIFSPGFPGLLEAIYVQERILETKIPMVYAAFQKHMISTTSYATKWYITLFANSVPFQTQLRIWDIFLLEGRDVFVVMAVAIVWVFKDHITSSQANFETILSLLSSFFVPEDDDALLSWMDKLLGDRKFRQQISRWREDWGKLVAAGKQNTVLL